MTLTVPSPRRCLPVTLRQVPEPVRFGAAQQAARNVSGETDPVDLIYAALFPSDTVYYVSASARPLLERWDTAIAHAKEMAA